MTFLNPGVLILLVLLPPVFAFLVRRERLRKTRLMQLGNPSLLLFPVPAIRSIQRIWKLILWGAGIVSLIVALARPIWGEEVNIVQTEGVSILVVLDVSKSMNAQDISPSRLERAKLAIQDLIDGLGSHEIGLVLFAGQAFVQFPLTTDMLSARSFISNISTDAISNQGTNIDAALRLAVTRFNDALSSRRFIILMTDGENQEGDPLQIVDMAAEQGITIFTVGYGTPDGAPIPIRDENGNEIGYQSDETGNTVLSSLDETLLESIAERTGGIYRRGSVDGREITELAATLNAVQVEQLGSSTELRGIERFSLFIAFALLALSITILMPEVSKKAV